MPNEALAVECFGRRASGTRDQLFVGFGQRLAGIAKAVGDGIAAVAAEIAARHLDARCRLPPLVFGNVEQAIEAAGANLLYLPPYSPDLNPIELAFAKFKNALRKAAQRTVDDLWRTIGVIIDDFSPQECQNYLRHDGYAST